MPDTQRTPALVPAETQALFRPDTPVAPLFYTYRPFSRADRVRRRIGVSATRSASRLATPSSPDELQRVSALWLSERVSLSSREWAGLLESLPSLRWIFSQRTSYHHLDLDLFRSREIAVSNSGDLVSRWVAEFALACIVCEAKRVRWHVERRDWFGPSVSGTAFAKTCVTIVGTGRIGSQLAALCRGLDMEVTGLSRDPSRFPDPPDPYSRVLALERGLVEALPATDFLVLAVPSSPETRNLIGRAELARLPRQATMVNVTHPEVLDQDALFAALRTGALGAAYLDRVRSRRGLWSPRVPHLVVTHNSSAQVPERTERAMVKFLEGLRALRERREPADRIA